MPKLRGSHTLRIEWADRWWDPSDRVLSMRLDQHSTSPQELSVVIYGHDGITPPLGDDLKIRCSWDQRNFWVGSARLRTRELTLDTEPIQALEFTGQFLKDAA